MELLLCQQSIASIVTRRDWRQITSGAHDLGMLFSHYHSRFSSVHRANSVEDAVRRGQRQVEQVKLKISMQMDDKTFQAALLETQV